MAGFLDQFRKRVISSVRKDRPDEPGVKDIDDKIALGVLLWVVAEQDEKFLPEEETQIKQTLLSFSKVPEEDISYVMSSIQQAARERIDLYRFTSEINKDLAYNTKISIIEILFRVACADKELAHKETEVIRKISGLLGLTHKDFITAKIKIKRESGFSTGI